MKFRFDNLDYVLEFQRARRNVTLTRKGKQCVQLSKYPFTSAKIFEKDMAGILNCTAIGTVGCLPTDLYSNATGRLFAMQELTRTLRKQRRSKAFIAAVWQAYLKRGEQQKPSNVIEGKVVGESVNETISKTPLQLPPSSVDNVDLTFSEERVH